jgi:hypothetical protein
MARRTSKIPAQIFLSMRSVSRRFPLRLAALASGLLLLVLTAGCLTPAITDSARRGPFFAPVNHAGESSLGGLRRVVLLPAAGGGVAPAESLAALDPVFAAELQRQQRFEVIALSREDCLRYFQASELSSVSALPPRFTAILQREFAADAVMFVDVTTFHAYQPLALGLRGKLATLDGVRLVWTFDNVFSADEAAVANSARRHFLQAGGGDVPADLSTSVLQSPVRFTRYAAAAMFATLPPVVPPAPPVQTAAVANAK